MKFIIGRKVKMTSLHRPDGRVVPATLVKVEPNIVTQLRTNEKDTYTAVQVGTGTKKKSTKALRGHLQGKSYAIVREFRPRAGQTLPEMKVGDTIDLSQFAEGDKVNVIGTSKGRGFQGVVKRHGFHGSPKTHGHKDQLRMPGSIGSTAPQRVFKGMRMGGHMGNAQITVKHLEVIQVNAEAGEILLKGAVPGAPRSLVYIQTA